MALVKNTLLQQGAAACGTVAYDLLAEHMNTRRKSRAQKLCPGVKGVIVALFSYYAGNTPGNIAKYARGEDYHDVLLYRLGWAADELANVCPGERFVCAVDDSPIPEALAARLSGAAPTGMHGLAICPGHGSYVVIGSIFTTLSFQSATDAGFCEGAQGKCGACATACPAGALRVREGERIFERELCLSHITQKKGVLSPEEQTAIQTSGMVWGCDACQDACPRNKHAAQTEIPEFREHLIHYVDKESLEHVGENRAFLWRGKEILRRNMSCINRDGEKPGG